MRNAGTPESLTTPNAAGATPAHFAAQSGHAACLRVLHELGAIASLSAPNDEGFTPAHYASQSGHAQILRVLDELSWTFGRCDAYDDHVHHARLAEAHVHSLLLDFCS